MFPKSAFNILLLVVLCFLKKENIGKVKKFKISDKDFTVVLNNIPSLTTDIMGDDGTVTTADCPPPLPSSADRVLLGEPTRL